MASDNIASLADVCRISSSQEDYLSRCRFAGVADHESSPDNDYEDIPVASTGIMIVSPPDSLEEQEPEVTIPRDTDVFHTPPEESAMGSSQEQQQTVAVDGGEDRTVEGVRNDGNFAAVDSNCTDNLTAVDLGRDTDLGFSAEVELTERIEIDTGSQSSPGVNQGHDNEVIECQSINVKVRERELDAGDGLCESPLKKSKIVDKNLVLPTPEPCVGSEAEKNLKRVVKSIEKLKSPSKNSTNLNEIGVLETSRDASGGKTGNLGKTVKNLSFEGISPRDSSKSLQNHHTEEVDGGDGIFQGTSSAKRKLHFRSEALESDLEDNIAVSALNEDKVGRLKCREAKNIDDIDKFRYVGTAGANSSEKHKNFTSNPNSGERLKYREAKSIDVIDKLTYVGTACASASEKHNFRAKRVLPMSLWANNGEEAGEVVPDEEARQVTLFDVLRELAQQCTYDPRLGNMSVLEAAKLLGMTFP